MKTRNKFIFHFNDCIQKYFRWFIKRKHPSYKLLKCQIHFLKVNLACLNSIWFNVFIYFFFPEKWKNLRTISCFQALNLEKDESLIRVLNFKLNIKKKHLIWTNNALWINTTNHNEKRLMFWSIKRCAF